MYKFLLSFVRCEIPGNSVAERTERLHRCVALDVAQLRRLRYRKADDAETRWHLVVLLRLIRRLRAAS